MCCVCGGVLVFPELLVCAQTMLVCRRGIRGTRRLERGNSISMDMETDTMACEKIPNGVRDVTKMKTSRNMSIRLLQSRQKLSPAPECARQLGQPSQVENELMKSTPVHTQTGNHKWWTQPGSVCVWCLPSSFLRRMRNHVVRCSWWLNFRCDTHFGRSQCCAQSVRCSPLTAHLEGTVEQAENDKQRERNKKKHAEKGDIKMVVANVTAPREALARSGQRKS